MLKRTNFVTHADETNTVMPSTTANAKAAKSNNHKQRGRQSAYPIMPAANLVITTTVLLPSLQLHPPLHSLVSCSVLLLVVSAPPTSLVVSTTLIVPTSAATLIVTAPTTLWPAISTTASAAFVVVTVVLALLPAIPTTALLPTIATLPSLIVAAALSLPVAAAPSAALLESAAHRALVLLAFRVLAVLLIVRLVGLLDGLALRLLFVHVVQPLRLHQLVHLCCGHGCQHLFGELVVDWQALVLLLVLVRLHGFVGCGAGDELVGPGRLVVLGLWLLVHLLVVTHQSIPDAPAARNNEQVRHKAERTVSISFHRSNQSGEAGPAMVVLLVDILLKVERNREKGRYER